MSEKKDNSDNLNEQDELGPVETNSQETESASNEHEADTLSVDETGDEISQTHVSDDGSEESPDDMLEDVRRSLITETVEKEKEDARRSSWWKRVAGGGRKNNKNKEVEVEPPEPVKVSEEPPVVVATREDDKQGEYVEQLDELIDMLGDETEEEVVQEEVPAVQDDEVIPEKEPVEQEVVDLAELKKRAFHARTTPEEEERSLSEVRSVALGDEGEEVFVEVEAKAEDTKKDRMKAIENAFIPYRRYIYFIFIFVSIIMILIVSVSLYRVYQRSLPPPPVEPAPLLPYPVGMNLPGGVGFKLGKGKLQDGKWDPRGPEWLEGTEICRWIAIPYSRQLEAVIRTLKKDDPIELLMSNNDTLVYKVSAIDQLSLEEMQALDSNSPCMLLMLAQPGADKRWVVTAVP